MVLARLVGQSFISPKNPTTHSLQPPIPPPPPPLSLTSVSMVDAQLKSLRGQGHCPWQAAFTDLSVGQTHRPGFGYYQRGTSEAGPTHKRTQSEAKRQRSMRMCPPCLDHSHKHISGRRVAESVTIVAPEHSFKSFKWVIPLVSICPVSASLTLRRCTFLCFMYFGVYLSHVLFLLVLFLPLWALLLSDR